MGYLVKRQISKRSAGGYFACGDIDFDFARSVRRTGKLVRAGGFRVVRPTSHGPQVVAYAPTRDMAEKLRIVGNWVEVRK